ncbi:MAG: ABC transporter permease [Tannerellaceae bacterium]|nr:ABC transporter permease [Tannerellaceae bacterium]
MNKIGLIIQREYLRRVKKRSFLFLTFFTPFLFIAVIFVPLWLSTLKSDYIRNIVILDDTGRYAGLFPDTDSYVFTNSNEPLEHYKSRPDKSVFAFLSITDVLLDNPRAVTLYSEKQVPADLTRLINQTLTKALQKEKLESYNIPNIEQIIEDSKVNYTIQTIKWDVDGKENSYSSIIASVTGIVFTFIIYLFIMMYGGMVMQGVMEEKTNRIIEIMISSVSPYKLMAGKIIGIGLVGITQVFLWGILTLLLFGGSQLLLAGGTPFPEVAAIDNPIGGMNPVETSPEAQLFSILHSINIPEILFYFIIYFIGGYILYASIFAAIGSAVDSPEDTHQYITPMSVFMLFALYAGFYSMENPDGPLAFWCSIIPFSSPIVMMVRIPFEVPVWEKILSILILYVSAFAITVTSAKIYRIGILMYGKKPRLKEIFKWIRNK